MGNPPVAPISETILIALKHQQAGRIAEAEQLYRQVLQQQPDYVDALNLLGALLYQQSQFEAAVTQFQRVLDLRPDSPDALNSVGVVLKAQGNLQAAIKHYQQALRHKPDHPEVQNNLGNALRELGQLNDAIAAYEQALRLKPNYPEAHHNLGMGLKDVGKLEEAIAQFREAILLKPNYAEAHQSLGAVLQKQGKPEAAIGYYQQAIALKSNYAEAYNSLGNALQQQGKHEDAIAYHQHAIALKPDFAEAHQNLANALQQLKRSQEAETHYRRALDLRPLYPEAYNNLGNALQEQGNYDGAIAHYQKALELRPNFPEALSNIGTAYKDQKKLDEAIVYFQQALELRPDYAEVHNNLGNAYQEQGRTEDAIACYRAALALKPDYPEIHSNLGNLLQQQGDFNTAFAHFEQAIALQPDYAGAYNNWGIALRNHGQVEAALATYEQAIALNPDFVEARWNIALTQLLLGDIEQGFAGYEWRFQWSKFQEQNPPRQFSQPRWDGSAIAGKTILIYTEQGMGDTIQFIRYVSLLAAQGARAIVECQPPLVELLSTVPGIAQTLPYGAALPNFDVYAPLLSLPYLLGTTLETIPAQMPYIQVPPSEATLPPTPRARKIGIVWSGNPQNPYNRTRTVPLELLLPLATLPDIQLYSLQKDVQPAEAELLQSHPEVIDLRSHLTDFRATAALINQLDLVISVDTAVTHLAGALAKPVWLLLPFSPDWRWLLDRSDSPWYSTLRIFRQPTYGDWDSPIAQIEAALLQREAKLPARSSAPRSPNLQTPKTKNQKLKTKNQKPNPTPLSTVDPPVPSLPETFKAVVRRYQAGKIAEAEQLCCDLLQQQPDRFEGWHLLGLMRHQQQRYEEAIVAYRQVVALKPDHYETYNNLGVALQELKQIDAAIAHYEKALALKPDYADAHNNYANAVREAGQLDKAIHHYQQAIALKPSYADAYNNLGLALYAKQQYDAAAAAYQQAIALKPDYAQAHNHLGNALKEMGDFEQAAWYYQQAIALKPDYAKAYNNWGNIFRDRGDLQTATRYYDQATAIEPDFAEAHWNKALTLLIGGDLQRGFVEYEWRWKIKLASFYPMRPFPKPLWDGSDLNGKTIFLHAEQGMGDMIQFIRYVPIVAQLGARVIVECHAPLINLFQTIPGVQQLLPYGAQPVFYDVHAPLMSLPRILGTGLETVPAQVPYLTVPAAELSLPETQPTPTGKIGIVWSGNPENPYNRTRAVPLERLLTLTDLTGIQFYSLQKDLQPEAAAQLQSHPEVIDLRSHLTDFVATATLINQLDLVISVDTAVTHLAGALGKPVWLLLPFAPDWRWLLDRSDSPWYPTLRIFRQSAYGDWDSPIAQIRQALLQHWLLQPIDPTFDLSAPHLAPAPPFETVLQLYQSGNLTEAERCCQHILQRQPDHLEARHALGVIYCRQARSNAAIAEFQRVLAVQPDFAEAWGNLGSALQAQGNLTDAVAHYQHAIALNPNYVDAHQNLAVALKDLDRLEAAVTHCERVIALKPDLPDIYYNLGFILRRLGRLEAAIAHYRRAIALKPDFVEAHKNLGHALLLTGDLPNGFAEYEWRWQQPNWFPRPFAQPLWDGTDLHGKTILLHAEQGMGDTIQFIRYAQQVRDRGGKVIVECQEPLLRLLETVAGIDRLTSQTGPLPDFDLHAPLLSLPHLLGTTLATIPAEVPYLQAPPDANFNLQSPNLSQNFSQNLKIGIAWTGNPHHKNNRHRSCQPADFRRLIALPGTRFYSLQKGDAVQDLQTCTDLPIHDLSDRLHDFADTAAAIAQLDLVITIDTAVAHLAGALGKPVWVLLSYAPDWRWLLDRSDSPWYPTMRLFRQTAPGNWQSVFESVQIALEQLLAVRQFVPASVPVVAATSPKTPIGIGWQLDLDSDWGIYSTHLALQLARSPQFAPLSLITTDLDHLPPLYRALLKPTLATRPDDSPDQMLILQALGNQFEPVAPLPLVPSQRRIGLVRLTNTHLTPDAIAAAKQYDRLIVGSRWNAKLLQQHGLEPVTSMFWGIDPSLFHPAAKANLFEQQFVIFSGGDRAYEGGQDLLLAAFKAFHAYHPETLLLLAWHDNSFADLSDLSPDAYLNLGPIPLHQLGQVLRSADVAVFCDRCTATPHSFSLASLACGIPTILAANTGHLDLIRHNLGYPLQCQRRVKSDRPDLGTDGWGESDGEELIETLERIYTNRQEADHRGSVAATFMQDWTWQHQIQHLLERLA
jgi:tetratricopeptide (TPR) repeat protein/glycosyltransferase involved in cell wall biosynthesis